MLCFCIAEGARQSTIEPVQERLDWEGEARRKRVDIGHLDEITDWRVAIALEMPITELGKRKRLGRDEAPKKSKVTAPMQI
jgi:hypothetical protein